MVRYQNLMWKPELFRAPLDLGPGMMYHPLNPPLAGPGANLVEPGQLTTTN